MLVALLSSLAFAPPVHAQPSCERNDQKRWKGVRVSKADDTLCEIERNRAERFRNGADEPYTAGRLTKQVLDESARRELKARLELVEQALETLRVDLDRERAARVMLEAAVAKASAANSITATGQEPAPQPVESIQHDSTDADYAAFYQTYRQAGEAERHKLGNALRGRSVSGVASYWNTAARPVSRCGLGHDEIPADNSRYYPDCTVLRLNASPNPGSGPIHIVVSGDHVATLRQVIDRPGVQIRFERCRVIAIEDWFGFPRLMCETNSIPRRAP